MHGLDVLRGFAVLAIFVVNIKDMTMPVAYYLNPSLWPSPIEQAIAQAQMFVIDDKWRTVFTALYGAGLVMISDRLLAQDRGRAIMRRRNLTLMLFGLLHMALIWDGDILFLYGLTGLLALPFTRKRVSALWWQGSAILVFGSLWVIGFHYAVTLDPAALAEVRAVMWTPTPESLAEEIGSVTGSSFDQVAFRLASGGALVVFSYLLGGILPVTLGLMVLGMALFRAGFFHGTWPGLVLLPLGVVSLAAAWALDGLQLLRLHTSGWAFETFLAQQGWALADGVLGAFGYACVITVLTKLGVRLGPLAAVGRMAFTNYIACSVIGGIIVGSSYGLGMFGEANLVVLMGVVTITSVFMLTVSPLWLRVFRFGPLEWLWRSVVYGQAQPLRR